MTFQPQSGELSPRRYGSELLVSLFCLLAITVAWYAWTQKFGMPQPSSFVGHLLGVLGFALMLCTEILYSIRKRWSTSSRLPTRTWLQIHICTGIVGSYLVLLHSAGKFSGLAGIVSLLTLVTVASGFVGRYIYTAVPRTLGGSAADLELEQAISRADQELQEFGVQSELAPLLATCSSPSWLMVVGRPWMFRRQRQRLRQAIEELPGIQKPEGLFNLLERRLQLQMQTHTLAATRRLLARWHFFHVPLSVVLFTLAVIHIGAALHYATFSK